MTSEVESLLPADRHSLEQGLRPDSVVDTWQPIDENVIVDEDALVACPLVAVQEANVGAARPRRRALRRRRVDRQVGHQAALDNVI